MTKGGNTKIMYMCANVHMTFECRDYEKTLKDLYQMLGAAQTPQDYQCIQMQIADILQDIQRAKMWPESFAEEGKRK